MCDHYCNYEVAFSVNFILLKFLPSNKKKGGTSLLMIGRDLDFPPLKNRNALVGL